MISVSKGPQVNLLPFNNPVLVAERPELTELGEKIVELFDEYGSKYTNDGKLGPLEHSLLAGHLLRPTSGTLVGQYLTAGSERSNIYINDAGAYGDPAYLSENELWLALEEHGFTR